MLDIDLEYLKFLINPTYEYIKEDINVIANEYSNKSNNQYIPKIKFLFLTPTNELADFIFKCTTALTEDVYKRFGDYFGFNIKNNISKNNDNFIIDILKQHNLKYLEEDKSLKIFKTDIRNYLINIIETSKNEKDLVIALNAIEYMDELIEKYNNIKKILNEPCKKILEIYKKKAKIKKQIQKQIIKDYSHLLTENGKNIISKNKDYDVEELLKNEKKFNYYLDIKQRPTDVADFEVFFLGKIEYSQNLKDYQKYYNLRKDLIKYNYQYNKECEDYTLMMTKNELKQTINDLFKDEIKKLVDAKLFKNKKRATNYYINRFVDNIYNKYNYNFYNPVFNIITISPLTNLKIQNNQKIVSQFYHILSHEIGHAYDYFKKFTCDEEHDLLYEIYNEYRSIKIINKLIETDNFNKNNIIHTEATVAYTSYLFGLIDLFGDYSSIFDNWLENSNIKPVINLLNKKNFNKLIELINNYDYKYYGIDEQYLQQQIKEFNIILEKTKKRTKIKKLLKQD